MKIQNYTGTFLNNQDYCLYKDINSLSCFTKILTHSVGESAINFMLMVNSRVHGNSLWSNSYRILKYSHYNAPINVTPHYPRYGLRWGKVSLAQPDHFSSFILGREEKPTQYKRRKVVWLRETKGGLGEGLHQQHSLWTATSRELC